MERAAVYTHTRRGVVDTGAATGAGKSARRFVRRNEFRYSLRLADPRFTREIVGAHFFAGFFDDFFNFFYVYIKTDACYSQGESPPIKTGNYARIINTLLGY